MTDGGLILDPPADIGQYLGCGQAPISLSQKEVDERMANIKPLFEKKTVTADNVSNLGGDAALSAKPVESIGSDRAAKDSASTHGIKAIRYDMVNFFRQCVDRYCELANVKESSLAGRKFKYPGIDDHQLSDEGWDTSGHLASLAAKVLMKIAYGANTVRWDLLHDVYMLAREITKWNKNCDTRLHKLLCYLHQSAE